MPESPRRVGAPPIDRRDGSNWSCVLGIMIGVLFLTGLSAAGWVLEVVRLRPYTLT